MSCYAGYIPVHAGYIPVHAGYIPVHAGYIPVHAGYIPVLWLETKKQDNNKLAELEAEAEAEFGAVAKADQKILLFLLPGGSL